MTTRRFSSLPTLTDRPALRLAPSGPRPNALPLHNVRYRKTRRFKAGLPSTFPKREAPRKRNLSKSHRKDRGSIALRLAQPLSRLHSQDLGGARRDRTDDLMLAKHALSQLSYGPVSGPADSQRPVVGLGGLEPPTSRLSSARSNQLSYKPGRKKKPHAR
jgi:hypothetical protein